MLLNICINPDPVLQSSSDVSFLPNFLMFHNSHVLYHLLFSSFQHSHIPLFPVFPIILIISIFQFSVFPHFQHSLTQGCPASQFLTFPTSIVSLFLSFQRSLYSQSSLVSHVLQFLKFLNSDLPWIFSIFYILFQHSLISLSLNFHQCSVVPQWPLNSSIPQHLVFSGFLMFSF